MKVLVAHNAYLKPGVNGVMTANTLHAYVDASVGLLLDDSTRTAMRTACLADAAHYTLGHMSHQFTQGVLGALASPIRRGSR